MPHHVGPQPCSSRQDLQEIRAGPSGGYEFANPQLSYAQSCLGHSLIELPSHFTVEYGPQNLSPNDDENNCPEAGFNISQFQFPLTPPSSPEGGWGWSPEVDVQPLQRQMWGLAELNSYLQGAPNTINYADDSDTTDPRQSFPSVPGGCYSVVAANPPQTPHETSYDSSNLGPSISGGCYSAIAVSPPQTPYDASYGSPNLELYQSTPESFSDTNRGIQQSNRYRTESSSSGAPRNTLPTQSLIDTDPNFTPDYPATHSNHQPLRNHRRAPQGNQQDTKPVKPRPLHKCAECPARFKRPGDLQRHLDTATAHGPAKGPFCPIEGCKYPRRFTRVDNLKAHLVKIHKVNKTEAAWRIQRVEGKGRS